MMANDDPSHLLQPLQKSLLWKLNRISSKVGGGDGSAVLVVLNGDQNKKIV